MWQHWTGNKKKQKLCDETPGFSQVNLTWSSFFLNGGSAHRTDLTSCVDVHFLCSVRFFFLQLNPSSMSVHSPCPSSFPYSDWVQAVSGLHLRKVTIVKDSRSTPWALSLHLVLGYSDSCWLQRGTAALNQRFVCLCACVFLHTSNFKLENIIMWICNPIVFVYQSSHISMHCMAF